MHGIWLQRGAVVGRADERARWARGHTVTGVHLAGEHRAQSLGVLLYG